MSVISRRRHMPENDNIYSQQRDKVKLHQSEPVHSSLYMFMLFL